jgi:hypothetical protein
MSTLQGAYLLPLFHAIEQARGEHAYRQLPAPAPAGSLSTDDAPLGPYTAAHLIQNSYTAGLAHADALRGSRFDAPGPGAPVRAGLVSAAGASRSSGWARRAFRPVLAGSGTGGRLMGA